MARERSPQFWIFTVFVLAWLWPTPGTASQPSISEANQHINDGWSALKRGYDLENSGHTPAAIQAYQNASKFAEKALAIGDKLHFIFYEQPGGLYFLHGQSRLALAEAYISQQARMDRILSELNTAKKAFQMTLKIINLHYRHKGPEWATRRVEALFALGSVFFLQGQNAKACSCMKDIVTNLDPIYKPAIYTIESIDYMNGHRSQNITSRGIRLPDPPQKDSSPNQLIEYAAQIGQQAFGRWGSMVGMLPEDRYNW